MRRQAVPKVCYRDGMRDLIRQAIAKVAHARPEVWSRFVLWWQRHNPIDPLVEVPLGAIWVDQVRLGPQLMLGAPVPASIFAPDAYGLKLETDLIGVGYRLRFEFSNKSRHRIEVRGVVMGLVSEGFMHCIPVPPVLVEPLGSNFSETTVAEKAIRVTRVIVSVPQWVKRNG